MFCFWFLILYAFALLCFVSLVTQWSNLLCFLYSASHWLHFSFTFQPLSAEFVWGTLVRFLNKGTESCDSPNQWFGCISSHILFFHFIWQFAKCFFSGSVFKPIFYVVETSSLLGNGFEKAKHFTFAMGRMQDNMYFFSNLLPGKRKAKMFWIEWAVKS